LNKTFAGSILAITVIVTFSTIFGSLAYAQVPFPDEATVVIFSKGDWEGEYGRSGSSSSLSGQGADSINFSCSKGDSYEIEFRKGFNNDYMVINIIQDGELLNFGSTDSEGGVVSLSGECKNPQVPGNNNGLLAINLEKSDYEYGDIIRIDGTSKFISKQSKIEFTIYDPSMRPIWTYSFSISDDNVFTQFPKIAGGLWQTDGEYTLVAYYDDLNQVKQKFNVVQEKGIPAKEPDTQPQIDPPSLELDSGPSDSTVQKIPDWVKNTMQWFLDGAISEDEMISAIQYLVNEGIIKLD